MLFICCQSSLPCISLPLRPSVTLLNKPYRLQTLPHKGQKKEHCSTVFHEWIGTYLMNFPPGEAGMVNGIRMCGLWCCFFPLTVSCLTHDHLMRIFPTTLHHDRCDARPRLLFLHIILQKGSFVNSLFQSSRGLFGVYSEGILMQNTGPAHCPYVPHAWLDFLCQRSHSFFANANVPRDTD